MTDSSGLFSSLLAFLGVTLAAALIGELLVRGAQRLDSEGNLVGD